MYHQLLGRSFISMGFEIIIWNWKSGRNIMRDFVFTNHKIFYNFKYKKSYFFMHKNQKTKAYSCINKKRKKERMKVKNIS